MKKPILLAAGAFIFLLALTQSGFAQQYVYSTPPPNDTSLNYVKPQPTPKPLKRYHHRHHHIHKHYHKHYRVHSKPACRHLARRSTGLYLYYSLPGTACCGDTWQLPKANCCAQPGSWSSSPYATFKPDADDFIYSETNDDDTRTYDINRDATADDTIEEPDYY